MRYLLSIIIFVIVISPVRALKPERGYVFKPEKYALIYKEMDIITSDNIRIKAWYLPAQEKPSNEEISKAWRNSEVLGYKTLDSLPRPTIIIANGDGGNMSQLIQYAFPFITAGFNVALFDWRGFGDSQEWEIDEDMLIYTEFLDDYRAVVDSVAAQPETAEGRIALFGFSTGAYLGFPIAFEKDDVKAFAGRALLTDLKISYDILCKLKPERGLKYPEDYPDSLMPVNIAPKFNKPTYLIVGELDRVTPVWMSEKIFSLLPGEKYLWVVDEAEHGGGNGPEYKDFERFTRQLIEFFRNYL